MDNYTIFSTTLLGIGGLGLAYTFYRGIISDPKKAVTRARDNYSENMNFDKARVEYLHLLKETDFAMSFRRQNKEEVKVEEKYLGIINDRIPESLKRCIDVGATSLEIVLENWNDISE